MRAREIYPDHAGVFEDGVVFHPETGTPQGGVISPILANVYLHYALDLWAEKVMRRELRGEFYMVRYADDGARPTLLC